ncbi:uncharacterized protein EI90DRAFT_3047074 [Cantharellus anzutake]|uniref:uncharacterized protein n=1 Tax=Cantharellus anzutake TaxID=1750568 RepID=UPI001905CF98|nr:uncharacterized protein EI90DRAFT_3047074 [Cantharellus anzutake]KAF8335769.1 hypothetical protein EI90DRAFT_3047074 [Cantharellus anzutake]
MSTMAIPWPRSYTPLFIFDVASVSVLLLLSFSVAFVRSNPTTKDAAPTEVTPVLVSQLTPRRVLIRTLVSLAAATYAADAAVAILRAVLAGVWDRPGPLGLASYLIGLVAFSTLAILLAWKDYKGIDAWQRRRVRVFAALAIIFGVAHIIVVASSGSLKDRKPPVGIPENPTTPALLYSPFVHFALSVLRLLIILPLYPALSHPYHSYVPSDILRTQQAVEQENATNGNSLLVPADTPFEACSGLDAPKPQYGTFTNVTRQPSTLTTRTSTPAPSDHPVPKNPLPKGPDPKAEINLDPSWSEMWHRIRRLFPYLWPRHELKLEALAFFCVLLLVAGRFITFFVPATLKKLVEIFEQQGQTSRPSPWGFLLLYAGLRFLQGSGGLAALRDVAWTPVMQYSDRHMSQLAFDHLLGLSLAFHIRKKTGEILRILDRGAAINRVFELILFSVAPTIIDIIVALAVFVHFFNWTLSAVVFGVTLAYITASIAITSWRTKIRRQMNERDVITRGIHTDCLLNYETVKYFNGEMHEGERYKEAIRNYQVLEFKAITAIHLLNLVQNFIITFGLLIGSLLVAAEIVNGRKYTSDFVFFITYLAQFYGPLNNLGYIYRSINSALVDTERLLKLLDEPTDVNDKPGAHDLIVTNGEIEFRNVSFTYDDRTTALNNVSFKVPKGSSVALVGESGSGKSTILRLLYRFYDLKEGQGSILIDGQNIQDITQASLRRAIGVVPQDSVLFNDTIAYNIRYGKFEATQEEIEYAAQAAQMHERILSFPDGYETKVGERGVRLSGGEKQRVSIARTFLKNAPILLLDEATSALDTTTEKDIQKALHNLVTGRSSLSIAHRLSTIVSSDVILVLKDGEIAERGNHGELLQANGIFARMWAEQIKVDHSEDLIHLNETEQQADGYIVPEEAQVEPLEAPVEPEPFAEPSAIKEIEQVDQPREDIASSPKSTTEFIREELEPPKVTPEISEAPKDEESKQELIAEGLSSGGAAATEPVIESPVASPFSAPVAFPVSDDASSVKVTDSPALEPARPSLEPDAASISAVQSPGIKFAQTESPRTGTPEPTDEGKRRRVSSQNFQKIARRISLGGKKGGQQAADAARAVARALTGGGGDPSSRPESPTPRETLATRMGFRRAGSKDDSSQREGSVRDSGSFVADDSPTSSLEPSKTKKNKSNKGKK